MAELQWHDKLTILSLASTKYIVDAYDEVVKSVLKNKKSVLHVGLGLDLWYKRSAIQHYLSYGYKAYLVPRPFGNDAWWLTCDADKDFEDSLPDLELFVENIFQQYRPNVFLLADDTGRLEVFFIEKCKEYQIPIIFMEHGPFFFRIEKSAQAKIKFQLDLFKKEILRLLLFFLKKNALKILLKKFTRKKIKDQKACVIKKYDCKLPGQNGATVICAYCEKSMELLKKNSGPFEFIENTGYPYWDKLLKKQQQKKKYVLLDDANSLVKKQKKKILIVSSGRGSFGFKESADRYYAFICELCAKLCDKYDFSLRLKSGERLPDFLGEYLLEKLRMLNISMDDNNQKFCDSVFNYDLIIGEMSTVLIEAIFFKKPVVLLLFDQEFKQFKYGWESILKKKMNVFCANNVVMAERAIETALNDQDYTELLAKNLKKCEGVFFSWMDGNAGSRIASIVLRYAKHYNNFDS